jgi:hypothetical protein
MGGRDGFLPLYFFLDLEIHTLILLPLNFIQFTS